MCKQHWPVCGTCEMLWYISIEESIYYFTVNAIDNAMEWLDASHHLTNGYTLRGLFPSEAFRTDKVALVMSCPRIVNTHTSLSPAKLAEAPRL